MGTSIVPSGEHQPPPGTDHATVVAYLTSSLREVREELRVLRESRQLNNRKLETCHDVGDGEGMNTISRSSRVVEILSTESRGGDGESTIVLALYRELMKVMAV